MPTCRDFARVKARLERNARHFSSFVQGRAVLRIGIETKDAPDCFDRYKASESLGPARSKHDSDEYPHKTAAVRQFREYRRAAHVVEVPDRTGLDELKFIACSRFCEPEKVRITRMCLAVAKKNDAQTIEEQIVTAVVNEICQYFDFDDTEER
jgi:hypothetical protein